MRIESPSTQIPLPFATAAIGLCLSYLFPIRIGAFEGTTIGFAVGVLLLYLAGRFESKGTEPDASDRFKCPKCGAELHVLVGSRQPSYKDMSHLTESDQTKNP